MRWKGQLRPVCRRDPGHRRRIRLRQVHHRPLAVAPGRYRRRRVEFGGRDLAQLPRTELRQLRRDIQFIFQDPFASLDPRMTVGYSIMEPLLVHGMKEGAQERVDALLTRWA
jgi:ABC-type glutathione transport system ATPase component